MSAFRNQGSRALVVGAGLGGGATARALQTIGFEVDLIEQRSAFQHSDGAGLLLPANATAVLDALGHRKRVESRARQIQGLRLTSSNGKELGWVNCRAFRYPTLGIRYAELRNILLGGLNISFGTTVESLECGDKVGVKFNDGSTREYDLVVGADGVHSKVRKLCFDQTPPSRFEQFSGYRFVVDDALGIDTATTQLGNGLTFLLVPLADNQTYCGAGPIDLNKKSDGKTIAETIARTYRDFPIAAKALAATDTNTTFAKSQFWQVATPLWHKGRIALLGDAAHATPPTLSQGTAMALEDCTTLVNQLNRSKTIEEGLAGYQQKRTERIAYVQSESTRRMLANRSIDARSTKLQQFASTAFGSGAIQKVWNRLQASDAVSLKEAQ